MERFNGHLCCISVILVAVSLTACSTISNWFKKEEIAIEEQAAIQEIKPAHPIGVTYDVTSTTGMHKQISVFFDGAGLARILEAGDNWDSKTLIDFRKQEITRKNFNTNWQDAAKLDPYLIPAVLNAKYATDQKALLLGTGIAKGFPYHRWCFQNKKNEWEVWTDDNDSFPIYFRSIKNGEVTTWTIVSSWIDGSTYNRPTFFTLEADPPPPQKEKSEEEKQKEELEKQKHKQHSHRKHTVHHRKRAI